MTAKYWVRIAAGILVIFVIGIFVARGVTRAKEFVAEKLPGSLPMLAAGFHVDGSRIGDIQRLQFMRSEPGVVDSAVITVKLDRDVDASRVSCPLLITRAKPFGHSTRFTCASSTDSARLDLVPFGHVEILPDGRHVAILVPRNDQDDLRSKAYHGAGSHDSGNVDIRAANDSFSVTVNGRELLSASGHGNGGSFVVRGANGKPIIEIGGDSNGGSVKITDTNGKTRVDIHGGNSGASPSGH